MSPSDVNPEIATPKHMTAKIAATIMVAWMEIFKCASFFRKDAQRTKLTGAARTARKHGRQGVPVE
jgi:hypothetical protein